MADLGTLRVTLVANLRKFTAQMQTAVGQVKRFAAGVVSGMRRAARAVADFALRAGRSLATFATRWLKRAGIAMLAFAAASIKMAIDVEEAENLIRVSFKEMTQSVIDWSEKLQKELGLNANTLQRQAGLLNLLTKSMGLTTEEAFRLSTSITEVAVHVASLRNVGLEETLEKMRSGLLGMSRPLKDIGINVDENAIKQLLLKEGMQGTVETMTQAQKIMARYVLIMKAAKDDTGDLSRTADDTQNVIRIFWEQVKLLSEELGTELLPTVTVIAIKMRDWLINNREDIVLWFGTAMDKFQAFVAFLRTDWQQGMSGSLEIIALVAKATVDAIVAVFKDGFERIGWDSITWIINGWRRGLSRLRAGAVALGKTIKNGIKGALGFDTGDVVGLEAVEDSLSNVDKVFLKLSTDIAAAIAKVKVFGATIVKTEEEIAALREKQAARDAELAAQSEAAQAKAVADQLATLEALRASMAGSREQIKKITEDADAAMEVTLTNWQSMWKDAAGSIVGSMRTAWADAILQAKTSTEIIAALVQQMARSIIEASFTAFVQPGISSIFSQIAGTAIGPQRSPATRNAQFFSGGGVVKPVFAANGFSARGTDTVPAMLTPGEMVLPKEIVELLGNQGGGITFNVNAIDAQGTAQWLNNNKRLIAGMVYDTNRGNNPAARRLGSRG